MKTILQEVYHHIFSLLFSIALTYWTMSSFFGTPILGTLAVSAVIHALLFIIFVFLRRRGIVGGLYFFLGSLLYLFITVMLLIVSNSSAGIHYVIWVITARPDSGNVIPEFWFVTIMISSYGFASTVFYFTVMRFRMAVLFLIGIIAFMLQSAKTDKQITMPFIIFLILFFALYMERTRRKSGNAEASGSNWGYTVAMSLFIGLTLVFAMVTPKPDRIPKLAYLDAALNQTIQPFGTTVQQAIQGQNNPIKIFSSTSLKNESVIDSMTAPLSERVLFEVEVDEPLYFRVQSWNTYERNRWVSRSRYLSDGSPLKVFSNRPKQIDVVTSLLEKLDKVESMKSEFSGLANALDVSSNPPESKRATVITRNYFMPSFLTPPGITDLIRANPVQKVLYNELGCCFLQNGAVPATGERYIVNYISQQLAPSSKEYQIMRKMDMSSLKRILSYKKFKIISESEKLTDGEKMDGYIGVDEKDARILGDIGNETDTAYDYFTELPENLPKRIYQLADRITAEKTSDYDKASAIEQYFHTSHYLYDLSPPSAPKGIDYNDFFLFESKKGVCVHFASAMVILARACGLPARYVEGFVADEMDPKTGHYLIREKNSHAFPEVYIAGYGWMVFEPTISREAEDSQFDLFIARVTGVIKAGISRIAGFISVMPLWVKLLFIPYFIFVILLFIWFGIRIRKSIWKKGVLKMSRSLALGEIYAKISLILRKINLDMKKHETPSVYASRVLGESGIILSDLTEAFYKAKYGGIEPSVEEITRALGKYKEVTVFVKKRIGKLKAWMV